MPVADESYARRPLTANSRPASQVVVVSAGMALLDMFRNGARIGDKHVESGGTHSDPGNRLELDGLATRAG